MEVKKMVNVDEMELDFYKKNEETELRPWLNVENAREAGLLGKWYTVKKAYVDDASVFDKEGHRIDGQSVEKWHLDFEEIPHKMTLNKTNFETMKRDFGNDNDKWVGQKVKFRVQQYAGYNPGIVIIDKQELKDMGETPPSSNSNDLEAEVMDLSRQTEQAKDNKEQDWFDQLRERLPKSKEDLEYPEKVAIEWINRIRMDLIDNGTKRVTLKMIRDNVNILWQEEEKDYDLGLMDEEMAGRIFQILKGCE
jgi:hypothetical protein